jgi:cytochrome c nitrite reductase small subunit
LRLCNTAYVKKNGPLVLGVFIGMVLMALLIEGYHASADPTACIACHSMNQAGGTWRMSNHKQFDCTECHMPASNGATRFLYKARAGLHDLWHETVRDYPASLVVSPEAKRIAQGNCVRCHRSTMERVAAFSGEPQCMRCHRRIVHKTRKEIEG